MLCLQSVCSMHVDGGKQLYCVRLSLLIIQLSSLYDLTLMEPLHRGLTVKQLSDSMSVCRFNGCV